MNGIEKITQMIQSEAQTEIDGVLEAARRDAAETAARYEAQARAESAELAAKQEKAAAEREERLVSVAQLEARKTALAAKQEMVERAYALALEKLCTLPEEKYITVLAELMAEAAATGREEVLFSDRDRERVGKAAGGQGQRAAGPEDGAGAAPGADGDPGGGDPGQGGGQCQRHRPGHRDADPLSRDPAHERRIHPAGPAGGGQLHL